jgi:hypothetical protein
MLLQVLFGEDMSFGCAMRLNESAFASLCTEGAAASSIPFVGLGWAETPAGVAATLTHVGALGNSDPLKSVSRFYRALTQCTLVNGCSGSGWLFLSPRDRHPWPLTTQRDRRAPISLPVRGSRCLRY